MWWRSLFVFMMVLLTGCGFTPLYSKHQPSNTETIDSLRAVALPVIPGRNGQIFLNELSTLVNPSSIPSAKEYALKVDLSKTTLPIGIERDRHITRYNILIKAPYTLTRIKTGKVVDKGTVKMVGSYDSLDSDFATFVAEEDTTEHTLKDLARELKTRLVVALLKEESHETSPSAD